MEKKLREKHKRIRRTSLMIRMDALSAKIWVNKFLKEIIG